MRIQQDFLDYVVKIYTGNYEKLQLLYIFGKDYFRMEY